MKLFDIVVGYTKQLKTIYSFKNWKYFPEIFKVKWIDGECRHFCFMCKWYNMCYDNLDELGGFRK